MNAGSTIFTQLMAFASRFVLDRCIRRYRGNHRVRRFSCREQFLVMAFAQLTFRESLRDIEVSLGAVPERLYHLGLRHPVSRSTLADANEKRDWRIYADFAKHLIAEARRLYADDARVLNIPRSVYALDATTIDLCLALFPWARFRRRKGAVKLHTLLDLNGSIPTVIAITPGNVNEVNILDQLLPEPGAIYVVDRGYTDFRRLYRLHQAGAFFVIRGKRGLDFRRRYSRKVDRTTGLICDQTIVLQGPLSSKKYPDSLRRVRVRDLETGKSITLLTNDFHLSARTIAICTAAAGRSRSSSSGSSNTSGSKPSTALRRTP